MFMVIKVKWSLKDLGTGVANASGLQKCPVQAQRQRPGGEQWDKARVFARDRGRWSLESVPWESQRLQLLRGGRF